ncbi:MAG: efflux RND transporter periplasmic adaptor subunit, partial [Prevotella sp.]
MKKTIIIGVVLIAVAVIAYFLLAGGAPKVTVEFEKTTVEKTNIQNSITATGTIEPVTSVTVGTQVS